MCRHNRKAEKKTSNDINFIANIELLKQIPETL